jgi:hypothetical protein
MTFNVTANPTNRLGGLRRFAIAITVFNILGHTVFGFEQAWIQPTLANRGSQAAGETRWTFSCRRISPALPAPCFSIPM